jgi:hypothetical protein
MGPFRPQERMNTDPQRIHRVDQQAAELRDVLAPTLGALYKALLAQDFTPEQALLLTVQYMHKAVVQVVYLPKPPEEEDTETRGHGEGETES